MFSNLVDEIVTTIGNRRDRIPEITGYVNLILRRLHAKNAWDRDFCTQLFNADCNGEATYVWNRPPDFRKFRTVRVNGLIWLKYERIGRHLVGQTDYYYASKEAFVFVSANIQSIEVGYYSKPPVFKYYPLDKRPARINFDTDKWEYLIKAENPLQKDFYADRLEFDHEEEMQQALVSDWLMESWRELVKFGALNLIYTSMGDDRAGSAFAIFRESLKDLVREESCASTDN